MNRSFLILPVPVPMLMYGKIIHKNLTGSTPLFHDMKGNLIEKLAMARLFTTLPIDKVGNW